MTATVTVPHAAMPARRAVSRRRSGPIAGRQSASAPADIEYPLRANASRSAKLPSWGMRTACLYFILSCRKVQPTFGILAGRQTWRCDAGHGRFRRVTAREERSSGLLFAVNCRQNVLDQLIGGNRLHQERYIQRLVLLFRARHAGDDQHGQVRM